MPTGSWAWSTAMILFDTILRNVQLEGHLAEPDRQVASVVQTADEVFSDWHILGRQLCPMSSSGRWARVRSDTTRVNPSKSSSSDSRTRSSVGSSFA